MGSHDLTIADIARLVQVNKSTFEVWLYGRSLPRFEQVPAIARVLEVDPTTLYELLGMWSPPAAVAPWFQCYQDEFYRTMCELPLTAQDKNVLLQIARHLAAREKKEAP